MERIPKSTIWKAKFLPYWRHFYVALVKYQQMVQSNVFRFETNFVGTIYVSWDIDDISIYDDRQDGPSDFSNAIFDMLTRFGITLDELLHYNYDYWARRVGNFQDFYIVGIMFSLMYDFGFSIDFDGIRTSVRSCISCNLPAVNRCSACPDATFCGSDKCSEKHFQINHEC